MLKTIIDHWEFLVGVITTIGGGISWWTVREKKKESSTEMLYEKLEELKKQLILKVSSEVAHATEMAEKQKIIEGLRINCPECYERFINNETER